jgi:hypothetical protein
MRPRPITLSELPNLPEVFLGLAALLVLIAGASQSDAFVVVMGLIMGAGALVSMGFAESPVMKSLFSFLCISGCFGVLLLVGWIQDLAGAESSWQTWALFVAGALSLLAAYRAILLHRY